MVCKDGRGSKDKGGEQSEAEDVESNEMWGKHCIEKKKNYSDSNNEAATAPKAGAFDLALTTTMAVGRDPDGDSDMNSSIGSTPSESDALDSGARTPTHNRSNMDAPSELSPPGSQPQQMIDASTADDKGMSSLVESQAGDIPELPGTAWNNKRAQDEYHRAMEHVVDQDFSLDEFGDPFDERDLQGN
ncbi:hypothetical protein N7539_001236 [Penicillium diatomitis]|uniref:Uncharacterized protein n=1 Tax=Penicillium diatomitis TaxID=2819901 RepID=A0A9X0C3F0_9EURO|nr:uncharacterized protein N7539_001236 [Penicillium diatomitis]KAJ5496120.1 hypothetical protein N7539_001236 [Penicillium diatomitis]